MHWEANVEQCHFEESPFERMVWGTKDAILGTMRNDNEASYHRIMGEEAARDNETHRQTNYRQANSWARGEREDIMHAFTICSVEK